MQSQTIHGETAGFYDLDAKGYDGARFSSPAGKLNHKAQIALVCDLLPDNPGLTVEIGSGTGRFTLAIAERATRLLILDIAEQMLRTARSVVPDAEPTLGDVTRLPLATGSVSTLVCLNVLNHIPDYEIALQEFGRVLEPDGCALVNFNNLASPYLVPGLIVNKRGRSFRANVFSHWQDWPSFLRSMRRTGFVLDKARGHLPIPGPTPRTLLPFAARLDEWLQTRPRFAPAPILLIRKG